MLALAADAETEANHLLFLGRKRLQDAGGLVANVGFDHRIYRRSHPAILDQVAQGRFTIPPDWSLERNRIPRNGLQLLDLFDWNVHPAADFVICRSSSEFLLQFTDAALVGQDPFLYRQIEFSETFLQVEETRHVLRHLRSVTPRVWRGDRITITTRSGRNAGKRCKRTQRATPLLTFNSRGCLVWPT